MDVLASLFSLSLFFLSSPFDRIAPLHRKANECDPPVQYRGSGIDSGSHWKHTKHRTQGSGPALLSQDLVLRSGLSATRMCQKKSTELTNRSGEAVILASHSSGACLEAISPMLPQGSRLARGYKQSVSEFKGLLKLLTSLGMKRQRYVFMIGGNAHQYTTRNPTTFSGMEKNS